MKRCEDNTLLFKQLIRWKDAAKDGSEDEDIKVGRKALNEVFRARIYMRKAGSGLEQFRHDLSNDYKKRIC